MYLILGHQVTRYYMIFLHQSWGPLKQKPISIKLRREQKIKGIITS